MLAPRRFLPAVVAVLCAPALASAQVAGEIRAQHRSGQTFLTWRELALAGVRYRVYRSDHPLKTASDLDDADFLGEVDDKTSRNQGRSLASGSEHTWIIADGGTPLDANQGLFVHTVQRSTKSANYAVTTVRPSGENRTLVPGSNATRLSMVETVAPPRPVLQTSGSQGDLWGHWVGNRDTPFLEALSPWPSRGFNFLFQRGTAPGRHGLVVRLHAAGQMYTQAWPNRFETPQDVDGLALSDLAPYTSWSLWFGSHELMPGRPASDTRVWNYTQRRMVWTIDWMTAHLGAAHDPERLYVVGGSMGAIGGMYLVGEYPERFAAALLRNGLYDLQATDYRNPGMFQFLFGDFGLQLRTRDELPILQRTNAVFMAGRDPGEEWPVLRTLSGRNDETVGWMSAVGLFAGLERIGRPAVHYFDERTHNPNGYWKDLERQLLKRTFDTRRDRPSLRFSGCTLDDDPGDGTRADGDAVGTINGYVDYDPATATASADALDFDVYLRASGALDDAPRARAWAGLGPWRTGPFAPRPGEAVLYTLRARGVLVDEHLLFADEHGRVRTRLVPLDTTARACRFERGAAAAPRTLFVGAAPIAGDELQVVVRGLSGRPWIVAVAAGDAHGPSWIPRASELFIRSGVLGPSGVADLWLPLPRSLPAGTRLWTRAVVGTNLTPYSVVTVQDWREEDPPRRPMR
jgi:hypothetical protein